MTATLDVHKSARICTSGVIKIIQYPSVTVLWGPEDYLVDIKISKILDSMNQQDGDAPEFVKLDADETEAIVLDEYLTEVSLFGQRRVILIKRPKWLGEGKTKKGKGAKDIEPVLMAFLENPGSDTHLIITTDNAPPDNGIVKQIKKEGAIEEVKPLGQRELMAWIEEETERHGSKIDRQGLNILSGSGQNMYSLFNEIERLTLSYPGQLITAEQLADVTFESPDTNIFKLVDALLKKRGPEALSALSVLVQKGEPAPLIIHMLTREFLLLGKVQALRKNGLSSQDIAKKLGQKQFRIDKMAQAGLGSAGDMSRVFNLLAEVDRGIKRTGQDERILLENLVIDICQ
ncbi:MAG: DNA polymerase III subunit delta [Ignavibacteriales bacterium]